MSEALERRMLALLAHYEADDDGSLGAGDRPLLAHEVAERIRDEMVAAAVEARHSEVSQVQVMKLLDAIIGLTTSISALTEKMAYPIRLPLPDPATDLADPGVGYG